MKAHPCEKGLTRACIKAYEKWARQALAYKLSHLLLPKELSRRLPGVLGSALVGPGAVLPPGLVLPPGAIVPPGFTWPSNWNPWLWFIFTTTDPLWAIFPPGWKPGDPLPWGVELPSGYELPAGWTPENPPPAFFVPGYNPLPLDPLAGPDGPFFVSPWEPGPPHRPYGGTQIEQITVRSTGMESLGASGLPWETPHDSLNAASYLIVDPVYQDFLFLEASRYYSEYIITRTIFRFPLTSLPTGAMVSSASISLSITLGANITACLQRCPAALFGHVSDYSSFLGSAMAHTSLSLGENKFPLDGDSLLYIQSTNPGAVYFMSREYNHDVGNLAPPWLEYNRSEGWTPSAPDPANRPALNISYYL